MTAEAARTWTHVEKADDPAYVAMAEAEAAFWSAQPMGLLERVEQGGGESPIDRYTNRVFTGDEGREWYTTIAGRGPFRRGLVLGTSAMGQDEHLLASMPELELTICDISPGTLARWAERLGGRYPGRVRTAEADFNFVDLPPDTYDLIVSSSTLHHVINLERLAAQVNGALTERGLFFLQDYAGETLFRFDARKKRIFELLYERDIARQRGRRPGLVWHNEDRTRFSPFCGIRSGDTLAVLRAALVEQELREACGIIGLMMFATPADAARPGIVARARARAGREISQRLPVVRRWLQPSMLSRAYVDELIVVDEVLSRARAVTPYNAFAVYGKRA